MTYGIIYKIVNYLKYNWLPVILVSLSVYDLRIDIRLLLDFFTFSTLFYTVSEHPLAITVLLSVPYLLNSFKKN